MRTDQLQKEKSQLIQRLQRLGLMPAKGDLDIVLGLNVEDLLKRRLQSVIFDKKLTTTVKQARQFIVHGHVTVDNKKVTIPSYIVNKDEEDKKGPIFWTFVFGGLWLASFLGRRVSWGEHTFHVTREGKLTPP